MSDEELGRSVFSFNEDDNGGEQLILVTKLYHNGDVGGYYTNQELTLNSYCNAASFTLTGCQISPEKLRELANQLESFLNTKMKKMECKCGSDTKCNGEVKKRSLYMDQLCVPLCETHLKEMEKASEYYKKVTEGIDYEK